MLKNLRNSGYLYFNVLLLVLFSCKKKSDVGTPTLPSPISVNPLPIVSTNPAPIPSGIESLDLTTVNFNPSIAKIPFLSTAIGYSISPTTFNTVPLTDVGWTHPSVLYFKDGWNGFEYWMAITPYPKSNSEYENPHIFCSHDGINWQEPIGIINPIVRAPEKPGYNSDVNLYFENDKLYCYWRSNFETDSKTKQLQGRTLYQTSSIDGVNWTAKTFITTWAANGIDVISPSIIKDDDMYYCYGVSNGETTPGTYYTNNTIRRMASKTSTGFIADKKKGYDAIKIENRPWGAAEEPWHLEARKIRNIWILLVSTTVNGGYGSPGHLFLGYSKDGINFNFTNKAICNNASTYKSSMLFTEDAANGMINVKLWRASSNNWSVFYDEFAIKTVFAYN